jgi:predicted neutral ceramidase superfamily lipid hydrolase
MIPEDKVVINKKAFQALATYKALAEYKWMQYARMGFLLYPICLVFSSITTIILNNGIKPSTWLSLIIMYFFALISLVIYTIIGRKRNYKYYLKKESKFFSDMLYEAEVRGEIENIVNEIS